MLSGTSCALVPSGKAVWLRIEEWNMHWPKLHFFWLSINYASNFPISLSLSYAANPPRYSSQVWRQRVWCRCRCISTIWKVNELFIRLPLLFGLNPVKVYLCAFAPTSWCPRLVYNLWLWHFLIIIACIIRYKTMRFEPNDENHKNYNLWRTKAQIRPRGYKTSLMLNWERNTAHKNYNTDKWRSFVL